ncbi:Rdx family protein [Bacillus sp. H-16]|uniref:Rdx family protein n=1 Tax=Alteribacter salitolerans TaxID=2912333 RepID=UPI0019659A8D|nr:Rdx family protein [Alteribacter salitolerans]MBM7095127.1 Rdx family protein [Alteribacter salitolerans]
MPLFKTKKSMLMYQLTVFAVLIFIAVFTYPSQVANVVLYFLGVGVFFILGTLMWDKKESGVRR